MVTPDYYPLKKAAEILNCSEDDLIHLGANDNLPIYILAAKYRVKTQHIDSSGASSDYGNRHCRLEKLAVYSLQELEAANQEATAQIERKPFYDYDEGTGKQRLNGYFHFTLEHKNMAYPSIDRLTDWIKQGKNPDDIYPPPVLIKDCALVITHAELIRLRGEKPKP